MNTRLDPGVSEIADGAREVQKYQTRSCWFRNTRLDPGGSEIPDKIRVVQKYQIKPRMFRSTRQGPGGSQIPDKMCSVTWLVVSYRNPSAWGVAYNINHWVFLPKPRFFYMQLIAEQVSKKTKRKYKMCFVYKSH